MPTYAVAYTIEDEEEREALIAAVTDRFKAVPISAGCMAVNSPRTADGMLEDLQGLLGESDQLYIIPMKSPHACYAPEGMHKWLANYLQ